MEIQLDFTLVVHTELRLTLSETAGQLCHLSLATTTQIISNEMWLLLSYIAKKMLKFVKYKISKVTVKTTLINEVPDFMYIRLPILKC